jgi:hypothetical protein
VLCFVCFSSVCVVFFCFPSVSLCFSSLPVNLPVQHHQLLQPITTAPSAVPPMYVCTVCQWRFDMKLHFSLLFLQTHNDAM